jgi:hypothetical protein
MHLWYWIDEQLFDVSTLGVHALDAGCLFKQLLGQAERRQPLRDLVGRGLPVSDVLHQVFSLLVELEEQVVAMIDHSQRTWVAVLRLLPDGGHAVQDVWPGYWARRAALTFWMSPRWG